MAFPVLFLFAAMSVGTDQTPVRAGCGAEDQIVASLPPGTPVEPRFRVSDGTDCVKIAASLGGKDVSGYVPASALNGLRQYDENRSASASVSASVATSQVALASARARATPAPNLYMLHTTDPALARAAQLLNDSRPSQALEQLQSALPRHPRDPAILMLAGLAAYRSDQLRTALDYWKQSLDLKPNNPSLSAMYEVAQREAASDRSGERLLGAHIALRYEGEALPADTARAILAMLDDEYTRISFQLGCNSNERIVAIVQNRDSYLRSTGAADWSGGQYDGRIHIAWTEEAQVGPQMQRALRHELVHACVTSIPSGSAPWPAWLQEGLAQKLSGDVLHPAIRSQLRQLTAARAIPRLENLGQDWSSLTKQNAVSAYSLALAAVDALFDDHADYGIRNVLRNPERLPGITADLDQKLGF